MNFQNETTLHAWSWYFLDTIFWKLEYIFVYYLQIFLSDKLLKYNALWIWTSSLIYAYVLLNKRQWYKELVKRHHPDANGGDRKSEERLQAVIQAYNTLKTSGFCG